MDAEPATTTPRVPQAATCARCGEVVRDPDLGPITALRAHWATHGGIPDVRVQPTDRPTDRSAWEHPKTCRICGMTFQPATPRMQDEQVYCSLDCARVARRKDATDR